MDGDIKTWRNVVLNKSKIKKNTSLYGYIYNKISQIKWLIIWIDLRNTISFVQLKNYFFIFWLLVKLIALFLKMWMALKKAGG